VPDAQAHAEEQQERKQESTDDQHGAHDADEGGPG
jgi:hypothetical protein